MNSPTASDPAWAGRPKDPSSTRELSTLARSREDNPRRVTESDVRLAYVLFLGREPESDDVIRALLDCPSVEALGQRFRNSPEFKALSNAPESDATPTALPPPTEPPHATVQAAPVVSETKVGEPVIRLENVTVRYRVPRERIPSIKDYAIRKVKGRIEIDEFLALKNVSLDIRRGETFGIIGHNGAGKSTLLRLIARVLRPSEGRVWVRGQVAPLLELGAGFDPELTGRENVFLNGAMLGQTNASIAERFDRIVDFAGVRDFIDMPLRSYSSGMQARLGFSVATDLQPDILILDELLSVGDAEFQRKSAERMASLVKHGDAILMVSHSLDSIQEMCHRVAWLHHGELRALGDPAQVIADYTRASGG